MKRGLLFFVLVLTLMLAFPGSVAAQATGQNSSPFAAIGSLGAGLVIVIISIAFWLLIFLVCREIVCWYWKINELVKLSKAQLQVQIETRDAIRAVARRTLAGCSYRKLVLFQFSLCFPQIREAAAWLRRGGSVEREAGQVSDWDQGTGFLRGTESGFFPVNAMGSWNA